MAPQSQLQAQCGFITTFPVQMNKAAMTSDPVERLKLVMTSNFNWNFYCQQFLKSLDPILGETYQAYGQDGTKIFF